MNKDYVYYAAYGADILPDRMMRYCPGAIYVGFAQIKNYRLVFRGSAGMAHATLDKKARRKVPAIIYRIPWDNVRRLDDCNGFPKLCRKLDIALEVDNLFMMDPIETVEAYTYVLSDDKPLNRPSATHLGYCREGYEIFRFDQKILDKACQESAGAGKAAIK